MGSRVCSLGLAAAMLPVFLGVARPPDSAPTGSARAAIQAAIERFVDVPDLREIHFDFNSWHISRDELEVLKANAARLRRLARARILVEGHTDEWGSEEYNFRLGGRRATAVREALIRRGLDGSAIVTVSYGKARPGCPEHHQVCWAENRRVHLRASVEPGGASVTLASQTPPIIPGSPAAATPDDRMSGN